MNSRDQSLRQAKEKFRKAAPDWESLLDGVLANDKVRIGQAITLIESSRPEHRVLADLLLEACLSHATESLRIGITGVPGVGKSTFINVFTKYLLSKGHQVAILAVDPSSKQTGGSILGDKTRMEDIFAHPKVLIRPSPAGETLGGVSSRTRETILLLEAAGYDRILVETVGVGQSETAVHSMTDVFLLLMLPGAGDELQGIKRGIMEMADILVVHKADGSNQQKSELALSNYKRALHLFPPTESDWIPRVIAASSTEETGIDQVEEAIESYFLHIQSNGFLDFQRKQQLSEWFQTSLELQLLAHIRNDAQLKSQFQALQDDVLQQKTTPYKAAEQIIRSILKS
jgi:LAO/AO transport system kinase